MDNIAQMMMDRINELDTAKNLLTPRTDAQADAEAEYDKALQEMMCELKAGRVIEANGKEIKWESVTSIDKIAKGLIMDKKRALVKATESKRDLHAGIKILESQLMSLSNLNRTQTEV